MNYQDTLPPGCRIAGEYEVVRLLGSGGFANTYLARDLSLGRDVAIKEYFPRDFAQRTDGLSVAAKSSQHIKDYKWGLERFTREAQIITRFRHPSIVRLYRVIDAHNTAYIVLEYVDGSDMERWLKAHPEPVQQSELDAILPGLLDALAIVHISKVLHRDIKPANIYLRRDGVPVLLDFGASKYAFGEKTGTTNAIVSRGYSAQEAYSSDPRMQGPWTDIYGMAATLYYAISGKVPPEATERRLLDQMVPAARLPVQGFRPSFLAAIDWGLRVHPKDRPQTVPEWRHALMQAGAAGYGAPAPRVAMPRQHAAGPTAPLPMTGAHPASASLGRGVAQPSTRALPQGHFPQQPQSLAGPPSRHHSTLARGPMPPSQAMPPPHVSQRASVTSRRLPAAAHLAPPQSMPYQDTSFDPRSRPLKRRRWRFLLPTAAAVVALIGGAALWRVQSTSTHKISLFTAIWPQESSRSGSGSRGSGAPWFEYPPAIFSPPAERRRAPEQSERSRQSASEPQRSRSRSAESESRSPPTSSRSSDDGDRSRSRSGSGASHSGSGPFVGVPQ